MIFTRSMRATASMLVFAPLAFAADGSAPRSGLNLFSIFLPKAMQANPSLEMTVFTEMTDYGKQLPEVSPEHPVYYIARSAGFKLLGMPMAGEHPPMPADFKNYMLTALKGRGFLPAVDDSTPPALVLIYFWGSNNFDAEWAANFPLAAREAALERAALVGGPAFAKRMASIMNYGEGPGDQDADVQKLLTQARQEIYYVSVSAFSFADLMQDKRRLAWRTTMTVTSNGVGMKLALPPLVESAGSYFGRPTPDPVAIRRTARDGKVTFGELQVIETIDAEEPAPPSQPTQPAR